MSVLTEFAMFPTDKGKSVSAFVSKIILMINESELPYQLTSMGTIFETETLHESLKLIEHAYEVLQPFSDRVYATAKFDIQKNKNKRLEGKVQSIEDKIGEVRK